MIMKVSAPFSQHVVIAERVRVAPAWRGAGSVGRYLAARMLPCVCAQPAVVATGTRTASGSWTPARAITNGR